jgi:hypothetical protein
MNSTVLTAEMILPDTKNCKMCKEVAIALYCGPPGSQNNSNLTEVTFFNLAFTVSLTSSVINEDVKLLLNEVF